MSASHPGKQLKKSDILADLANFLDKNFKQKLTHSSFKINGRIESGIEVLAKFIMNIFGWKEC